MKKKSQKLVKLKKNKQKQKQKQKQSIVVNIDNSRKTVAKPQNKKETQQQQQPTRTAPQIIPQPIYVPQYTPPPERPPLREEPARQQPVFNINPPTYNAPVFNAPTYNTPPLVPQQAPPITINNTEKEIGQTKTMTEEEPTFPSALEREIRATPSKSLFNYDDVFDNQDPVPLPTDNEDEDTIQMMRRRDAENPRTCIAVNRSGARKGEVCGRQCVPLSPFCGLHKKSQLYDL